MPITFDREPRMLVVVGCVTPILDKNKVEGAGSFDVLFSPGRSQSAVRTSTRPRLRGLREHRSL